MNPRTPVRVHYKSKFKQDEGQPQGDQIGQNGVNRELQILGVKSQDLEKNAGWMRRKTHVGVRCYRKIIMRRRRVRVPPQCIIPLIPHLARDYNF